MTTTYYISWQIKKSNRVCAWYSSKEVDTEEEARAMYEAKMQNAKVIDARLWKKDHYESNEMADPEAYPHGSHAFNVLAVYSRI